ncbi:MAG TPA: hypothetical protein VMP08_07825 [Anaerolineae bacterium]|nr:hypothetical protein [Anaerolineae bacterium]
MHNRIFRLIAVLVIAGIWLETACTSGLPPVDEKAFLAYLKTAQVPTAGITVTNQCVSVNISNDLDGPAAKQLASTVFTGICRYAQGYQFTIQYPGGIHTSLKWPQLQAYCDGKATIDQVGYVYYSTPSEATTCSNK